MPRQFQSCSKLIERLCSERRGAEEGIQIDSELMGRKARSVTYADLTFADQTYADFSISYYKKPSGSRGRARRALSKRVDIEIDKGTFQ